MYENIQSCVTLNKELSETFACSAGVRQQENWSPILFVLYVNDIAEEPFIKNFKYLDFGEDFENRLMKIFFLTYADYMVILYDSEEEMRRVLLTFYSYSNEWKLTANCSKTKIVVSKRGKSRLKYNVRFHGKDIENVDDYKYLEFSFNCNGGVAAVNYS